MGNKLGQNRKAIAAAVGGAFVVLVSGVLDRAWGIVLTAEEAASAATLLATVLAWLLPNDPPA